MVIGYDHRHNSESFARASAQIYRSYGHSVRLFSRIVPTPFVPSAIQYLRAGLGVMITASHNPRKDNGYKVYGGNGAQIGDEEAKEIAWFIVRERGEYRNMSVDSVDVDTMLLDEVRGWYTEKLKGFLSTLNDRDRVVHRPFVYTALHGVGGDYLDELFQSIFGDESSICHVEAQRRPDPNFPTVDFPNPEEGGSTLKMAMEVADAKGIDVIFANDPDADRFCVAQRRRDGEWRVFNGNEIAVLLADFISKSVAPGEKCAMLGSCVSSRFLKLYCERRGWLFECTKTGFKNLGNAGLRLKGEGYRVLIGFEEAIGFQVGDWNFDKDGLSALLVLYTLLCTTKRERERESNNLCNLSNLNNLSEVLEGVYRGEGCWPVQCNGYYFCKPSSRIKPILSAIPDTSVLPMIRSLKSTEGVVEVEFDAEQLGVGWLMLRSSGTEPKLKYYSEVIGKEGSGVGVRVLEKVVGEMLEVLIDPVGNKLIKKI